jgi:predicted dehydrogenase
LSKSTQNTKLVRLGIVGLGSFGEVHLRTWSEVQSAHIVAVCRRSLEPLKETQRAWNVPYAFTDYRALIASEEVDAVVIATPSDTHHAISLQAIKAGKHVFCEKPLALRRDQCKDLFYAAEGAGIVHCTNFCERSRTAVGQMKRYIDLGFIGRLYHINIWWGMSLQYDVRPDTPSWRFRAEAGGGTVYELIHVFDMVRFLAGDVKRICSLCNIAEPYRPFSDAAFGLNVTAPDSSAFLLQLQSNAYAVIHTSFVTRGIEPSGETSARVEVSGSLGRIATNGHDGLTGISHAQGVLRPLHGEPYPHPYDEFVGAILGTGKVSSTFHDGWKAAEIVDAAIVSAERTAWVDVSHGSSDS